MEDDADWDVNLKAQMMEFARGTRSMQEPKSPKQPLSPYGNDWDMLWLGHCGMKSLQEDHNQELVFYVMSDDPTVRPPQYKTDFVNPRLAEAPSLT